MLGVLLLWFGWIGFNGGSVMAFNASVLVVIINTFLAACAGLTTGIFVERWLHKYYSPQSCINGVLAGLVAITASCQFVSASAAIFIGAVGAIVAMIIDAVLLRYHIDDAVSAVPVHLGAGIWGTIAVAIFGAPEKLNTGLDFFDQLTVQALGVLVCGVWAFGVTYLICRIINHFHVIRICSEQEDDGLNYAEHKVASGLFNLIKKMDKHSDDNDLSHRLETDPFSDTGQIAYFYNQTMDSLEQATAELSTSKLRYETIADCSPVGIFNLDVEGQCQFVNKAWQQIFDTESEQYSAVNWANYAGKHSVRPVSYTHLTLPTIYSV